MKAPSSDWRVSIPLTDLVSLLNFSEDLESMKKENAQLRRELEGLRNMFSEVTQQLGDVKRELKRR